MKKVLSIILFVLASFPLLGQSDGISYQAVIIDPSIQQLPGRDVSGNIFPGRNIAMRFTIYNAQNNEEYQEIHVVTTDKFGMVNLMIGRGTPTSLGTGDFTLISWDGTAKNLQVEINFDGDTNDFEDMSRQELTFVPYAFHRNITATGDMRVDGTSDLNGRLLVQGTTNLNNTLNVNNENATNLSGTLEVDGETTLGNNLMVGGSTNLNDSLSINNQGPSFFSGDVTVAAEGTATFNGPTVFNSPANFNEINVEGPSSLNGQVTVRANMDSVGGQSEYNAYPLLVEGSKQGIAIRVNEGRSKDNNYISFWDNDQMWGRIEGITLTELEADSEYNTELAVRTTDIVINSTEAALALLEWAQGGIDLTAALSSSTACAGLGACVTAPIPSFIASKTVNLVLKVGNIATYAANITLAVAERQSFVNFSRDNIGVTYQSGAGDYAEWLPKLNSIEKFTEGEIVGVKNGFVTKNTWGVDKIMVVSTNPIVLGNMPQKSEEADNVKVAFMGQVPVKVIGKVSPGDYILPSDFGGGLGRAVNPDNMTPNDYKKIAGVAWNVSGREGSNVSIVNVAVGINANDLSGIVNKQQEELRALKAEYNVLKGKVDKTNNLLAELVPGYAQAAGIESNQSPFATEEDHSNHTNITYSNEEDIVYFGISEDQIEEAISLAREQYVSMLASPQEEHMLFFDIDEQGNEIGEQLIMVPMNDHPFWSKIDNDPSYKQEIIQYIKSSIEKSMHTHKKHAHKFTTMQIKD